MGRQQRRGPVVLAGRQADLLRVVAGRDLQHLRPGPRDGRDLAVHGRDRRGAFGPAAFTGPDGQEKVVFSGFQGLRFQLYVADAKKPFKKLDERALPPAPVKTGGTAGFVPAVEVAVDPEKLSRPKFKLFLDNAQVLAGVNSDQTFVSQVVLSFSDYLGDHRAFFQFDSVSTFSNFRVGYFNIAKRFQWGLQLYDDRAVLLRVQLRDRRLHARPAHLARHRASRSPATTRSRVTRASRETSVS